MALRTSSLTVHDILGRAKWDTRLQVIKVMSDGRAIEPSQGITAAELGLHSRDLSLFATDMRLSPQRATITVRGDRILFRTEAIKAIIEKDQAIIVKNKKDRHFSDILAPLVQVIHAQPHVPFELSVLEVMLHVTMLHFARRRTHIQWMYDRITGENGGSAQEGSLGAGDPFGGIGESVIQQFVLTAAINDIKETCDAIRQFLDEDRGVLSTLLVSNSLVTPYGTLTPPPTRDVALGATEYATSDQYRCPPADGTAGAGASARPTTATPSVAPGYHDGGASYGGGAVSYSGVGGGGRSFGVTMPAVGGDLSPAQRRDMLHKQNLEDASRILDTYLRELESIVGSLLETEDALDTQRETYRAQLDAARNHIILVNLWISVWSICIMLATLPSAFFGMNVVHGLEDTPGMFYLIGAGSLVGGWMAYQPVLRFFTNRYLQQSRQDAHNLNMLRTTLMLSSDDLESVSCALREMMKQQHQQHLLAGSLHRKPEGLALLGRQHHHPPQKPPLTRKEFMRQLRARLPEDLDLTDGQINYLFEQFDRDKDGVIREAEATLRSQREYAKQQRWGPDQHGRRRRLLGDRRGDAHDTDTEEEEQRGDDRITASDGDVLERLSDDAEEKDVEREQGVEEVDRGAGRGEGKGAEAEWGDLGRAGKGTKG